MTDREAIELLKYPIHKWSMDWDDREDGLSYIEAIEQAITALQERIDREKGCGFCEEGWQKALKKLTAYEETGLEPEDLALGLNAAVRRKAGAEYYGLSPDQMDVAVDLFQADKDGRAVVLPVSFEQRIYRRRSGTSYEIFEMSADRWFASEDGITIFARCLLGSGKVATSYEVFHERDIGKTVFLTREEAEKALEEAERND